VSRGVVGGFGGVVRCRGVGGGRRGVDRSLVAQSDDSHAGDDDDLPTENHVTYSD